MSNVLNRRSMFTKLAAIGIGSVAFQRALAHKVATAGAITPEMIEDSQWVAEIDLTDEEKNSLTKQLDGQLENERRLRGLQLDVDLGPASVFTPSFFAENLPEDLEKQESRVAIDPSWAPTALKVTHSTVDWSNDVQVASSGIVEQASALRSGKITSQRLTQIYLDRLKKFDPVLRCVVTLTEEFALQQAKRADKELKSGTDRGMLHGIPWGAKDIIAIPPFTTTWGGKPYREQVRPNLATVAKRLDDAGAVLLGKLSVGTYAMGDVWHEATTKNPWNTNQGSSGSSAGSSSAVGAGLCTFAIGSETLGSIVSPSRRCRVMGLRPSFGRVSRYGCMPLSWSMDKIGPIARNALDCGIVLNSILGPDGLDPTVVQRPFSLQSHFQVRGLRVGVVKSQLSESEKLVLEQIEKDGAVIVPIEYPNTIPQEALMAGLDVESAAVFDQLIRTSQAEEDFGLWGNSFRKSQFVRGIHYVQSMRARTLLIQETERVLRTVDLVLGSDDLVRTNLTGHPSMIVRCGSQELMVRGEERVEGAPMVMVPRTVKLTAKFFAESVLVSMGDYIQKKLPATPDLPPMFS